MTQDHALHRVAVVLNAKAGALLAQGDGGAALAARFAKAGMQAQFIGEEAGTLPERIAAALAAQPDAVVVAGGDGTIACAAQIMRGKTEIPLGILPAGTANLLARDLHLPVDDPDAAIAAIARARVQAIDVAEVNGELFLCAAMLGMPVRLGRHREKARGANLDFLRRMPRAAWRNFLRPNTLRGTLSIAGVSTRIRAAAVTVTVNRLEEATGLRLARPALDAGTLVVYEMRARGLFGWMAFLGLVWLGRWRRDPGLREWSAPQLRLEPRGQAAIHVMVDGEMRLLQPPLDFVCHPGALRVLAG